MKASSASGLCARWIVCGALTATRRLPHGSRIPYPAFRPTPEPEGEDGQQSPERGPRDAPGKAGPPAGCLPATHLGTALVTESRRTGERSAARMTVHGRGNLTGRNTAESVVYPE